MKASLEEAADQLHSAALHLMRWVRIQDESLGLSPVRLSALSIIVFGGPITLNRLAALEQVKPPTMCRIVNALEKQGFVKRKVSEDDQRETLISPTDKGTKLLNEGRKNRVRFLADNLKKLDPRELDQIQLAAKSILSMLHKSK
jgi:DNA-binding MarR family transcriptional regulator